MVRKIKIGILGAGPSGISAAIPFLKERKDYEVKIICSGESLFNEDLVKLQNDLRKLSIQEKHDYWTENQINSKTLVPQKVFFGSNKIFQNKIDDLKIENNINFNTSHTIGGLSNVWGANVCAFSQNDLNNYHAKQKILNKELEEITDLFPISGTRDDIDYDSNYKINYFKKNLNYCYQAKKLYQNYNEHLEYFKKNKIRVGYAKLAIQSENSTDDRNCENCGLCMYGCHKNSIFNSTFFLENIKNDIEVYNNTLIKNIDYKNENHIEVNGLTKGNQIYNEKFDKIILTTGSIDTAKLVLKLYENKNVSSFKIKDSKKYFFLYFSFYKSLPKEEQKTIGLSQLFLQTDLDSHTFHIQLYHSILLLDNAFKNLLPKKIKIIFKKIFSPIINRLMIGVIYFPEEISDYMQMSYNKNSKLFNIKSVKNSNNSKTYLTKIFFKLFKPIFKLKGFPIPLFIKAKLGEGQHFGASMPMNEEPIEGQTHLDGGLQGFKNIYIADISSLTRIPSTPPTFITMSNAYRISKKIISKSKSINKL